VQQEQQDVAEQLAPRQSSPLSYAPRVLRALCHYAPMELSDGPASLSKVRGTAVQHGVNTDVSPEAVCLQ
jgi:hypothetical protein